MAVNAPANLILAISARISSEWWMQRRPSGEAGGLDPVLSPEQNRVQPPCTRRAQKSTAAVPPSDTVTGPNVLVVVPFTSVGGTKVMLSSDPSKSSWAWQVKATT